ncbi:MAG: hypothetical protein M3041_17620 [Acidobacteriota bacterium]|nr:hypothetical protein [Acidobacteriota bacterium]
MNRSLRSCFLFTVAMICFAAFGYAQVTRPGGVVAITRGRVYSVKLTSTITQSSVALTTTVYSRPSDSMATAPWELVTDPKLRYTFSAQREVQSVCADTKIIATSLPSGNLNVVKNNLARGQYRGFSVHVTGLPTSDSVIGDATVDAGVSAVPAGSSRATTWIIHPPAGTKGPAKVSITLAVSSPPQNTSFQITILCGALCQPSEGFSWSAGGANPVNTGSYTLSTTMNPGSPKLIGYINEFRTSWQGAPDCTWVAYSQYSKSDYYLVP